jgi:flavin-dependent dehydrogenase
MEVIMFDVLIIGAGPSGSNLARLLAKNSPTYRVGIIEKRALNQSSETTNRIKSCGGLISEAAQIELAIQGLTLPSSIYVSPQFFKVHIIDMDNHLENDYPRHYLNIDRSAFDRYLFHLIPDTVEKMDMTLVTEITQIPHGYRVQVVSPSGIKVYETKNLVAADGANSFTRKQLIKTYSGADYFSIQATFESKQHFSHYLGVFDQSITDYYGWAIQKDNRIQIGCAFPRSEKAAHLKFQLLVNKLSAYEGINTSQMLNLEGAHIERFNALEFAPVKLKGFYLMGEAAGAISPSSAEGISFALKTSRQLAAAFQLNHSNAIRKQYLRLIQPTKISLVAKRLKLPAMFVPCIRKYVIKSGLTSLPKLSPIGNYPKKRHKLI